MEKCSYWSIKKANMFKAETLIEKVDTMYLKQVPWSPQQTIPDHHLNFPYSFKNFSAEYIHAFLYISLCAWVWVHLCTCVCCFSMWVILFVMVSHVNKARICSAEESVCVCVCVWERERERGEREIVSVCVFVYVSECVRFSMWVSEWASAFVMIKREYVRLRNF